MESKDIKPGMWVRWAPGKGELIGKLNPVVGQGPFLCLGSAEVKCNCGFAEGKAQKHAPQCPVMTEGVTVVELIGVKTPNRPKTLPMFFTPDFFDPEEAPLRK